jgi:hypothetical protein
MSKYITIYQLNLLDEVEKIEIIDGVIVNGETEIKNDEWNDEYPYSYTYEENVDGNDWDARYEARRKAWNAHFQHKPYNDNGREYNSASGYWEYTAAANGNVNPFLSHYEAPQDYQGSVPVWDGYNGE